MARPSKFNPDRGRVIVAALLDGQPRRASAAAAGVGLRTLAAWLARGRAGDPALAEWVRQAAAAERAAGDRRRAALRERYDAAAKERWRRFKAARESWCIEQVGPVAFWSRRLQWLAANGKDRAYAATVAKLRAEGFGINVRL